MSVQRRHKLKVALCFGMYLHLKSTERKKRMWVKKWRENLHQFGHMALIRELQENNPEDYRNYMRMDNVTFNHLLELVSPLIAKENTRMRESISAEERLVVTLRYLATGRSFEDLKFSTGISTSSISKIIPETCKAIYDALKTTYFKFPSNKDDWNRIALEFKNKWQFINCGGAFDGKHIRIVPPPHTGAQYYNYKNFYSIVLMALVNANYEFIYVDIGKNGRVSDGGVIEETDFYHKLIAGQLHLPENDETEKDLNFVFLGDEAFALHEHFLKPFPQRDLSYEKKIFNYRLSRARNVVENAFGLIAARFRVLHTAIHISEPTKICHVVLAICTLHNYLRKCSRSYVTATSFDYKDTVTHEVHIDDWRKDANNITNLQCRRYRTPTVAAKSNREKYLQYFNGDGKVNWQDEMLRKGKA